MPAEAVPEIGPIVAILRGMTPDRIEAVADAVFAAGIRAIEVPLNAPDPFASIAKLAARFGARCLCGAGTVLKVDDVRRVRDAGGRLIVSPNTDAAVIAETIALGLTAMPGFATASEAFAALAAGATRLKLFPAASYGPGHLRALRAVLPKEARVYAVGGIGADDVPAWTLAGAAGFGFGSELFKPDYSLPDIADRARRLADAVMGARRAT